jgi:heat shock protein 1/8
VSRVPDPDPANSPGDVETNPPRTTVPIARDANCWGFKFVYEGKERTMTVDELAVKFLSTIYGSAEDFIGRKPDRVVFVRPHAGPAQDEALKKASSKAGIEVSQIIDAPEAALFAYDSLGATVRTSAPIDRNVAIVDVGSSTSSAWIYSVRDGLYTRLSDARNDKLGGQAFDDKLVDFFLKEFTKKTKVAVTDEDVRSKTKMRLAVETTKRSLSASTSASCSVESLKDGLDFHGSITRMRFDLLVAPVYASIASLLREAIQRAHLDPLNIDQVILTGGSSRLPGIATQLESVVPEGVPILTSIEPDEVAAKGAVLQARFLLTAPQHLTNPAAAPLLSRPVGLVFPAPADDPAAVDGKSFVTLVPASTPLPVRRIVQLPVAKGAKDVVLSLWEGQYDVKVEVEKPAANGGANGSHKDDEEEEEEEEEEEKRTLIIRPTGLLAETKFATEGKDKLKVTIIIGNDLKGSIEADGTDPAEF